MNLLTAFTRDVSKALSPDLPEELGNMDSHLDFIIPKIQAHGLDLLDTSAWYSKRWKEIRDEEGFHESILHIFNPEGEYLLSLDGNIIKGTWRQLAAENTLILEIAGKGELFDLAFLNTDFLILTKHGDQTRKGRRRYFCLAHELTTTGKIEDPDWRNLMEKLFNVYRENSLSLWAWFVFLIIIGSIIYSSLK
jgi:hypothetical protein